MQWLCFYFPLSLSLFSDKHFLVFFFTRLRRNESGRYQDDFPFLSLCGRERNFLRCDDRPLVFTHLMPAAGGIVNQPISQSINQSITFIYKAILHHQLSQSAFALTLYKPQRESGS